LYSGDLVLEGGRITDVPGISVGHYADTRAAVVTNKAITSGIRAGEAQHG
jgi:L-aminopeptidase/D-esterase-like protein